MSSWTINKHLKDLLKLCKESLMGYYDKATYLYNRYFYFPSIKHFCLSCWRKLKTITKNFPPISRFVPALPLSNSLTEVSLSILSIFKYP